MKTPHRVCHARDIHATPGHLFAITYQTAKLRRNNPAITLTPSRHGKFIIRTVVGNDDFASMREVVTRRYSRLKEENKPLPGLILIDGGLGQLHAANDALEAIGILNQPLASIAKR